MKTGKNFSRDSAQPKDGAIEQVSEHANLNVEGYGSSASGRTSIEDIVESGSSPARDGAIEQVSEDANLNIEGYGSSDSGRTSIEDSEAGSR